MIVNLRDVGGCRTASGRSIARGRLFRSAEFDWAPGSAAHGVLNGLGVLRVIDLRAQSEVGEHTGSGSPVERVHRPFFASMEDLDFQPVDRSPPATAGRYYEFLMRGRASVVDVLGKLTGVRSQPTLIHCVAGRDRTGIVTACLLGVLGVPDEAIARDYAASHVMDDAEGRQAHPDNILNLLRIVRERHGSIEAVLGGADAVPVAALEQAFLDA